MICIVLKVGHAGCHRLLRGVTQVRLTQAIHMLLIHLLDHVHLVDVLHLGGIALIQEYNTRRERCLTMHLIAHGHTTWHLL